MATATLTRVPTARAIMQREVITVGPRIDALELVKMMNRYGMHGAPVVDDARQLLGVVSCADVRSLLAWDLGVEPDPACCDPAFASPDYYFRFPPDPGPSRWPEVPPLRDYAVEDLMSAAVFTVLPTTPTPEIGRRLRQSGLHRLLVVEGGQLAGLVTPYELLFAPSGW